MFDTFPSTSTEPEAYAFSVNLQGAGAAVPTRLKGRNNYGITRPGVGQLKLTFNDDPGVFLGLAGFGFGDTAAAANVLGWSAVSQVYTPPTGGGATPASLTITIGNGANAAADLAATSNLTLDLRFKRAATDL